MTLIEIGMVLAIMTILMALVLPQATAFIDDARMEVTAEDLATLHEQAAPIVAKMHFPMNGPGEPAGTVIPRTSLANVGALPAESQEAVDDVLPDYDGFNPYGSPYYLRIDKQNMGGPGAFAHDRYVATVDTCVPSDQQAIQEQRAGVQVTADPLCPGMLLARYFGLVTFSDKAIALRNVKRQYCCASSSGVLQGGGVNCDYWGTDPNANDIDAGIDLDAAFGGEEHIGKFCR